MSLHCHNGHNQGTVSAPASCQASPTLVGFKTPTAAIHIQRTDRKFSGSWARHTFLCSQPLLGWSYSAGNYVIFFLRLVPLKKPFLSLQPLQYSLWTSAYPAATFIISSIPGFLTSSIFSIFFFFNKKLHLRYETPIITFYVQSVNNDSQWQPSQKEDATEDHGWVTPSRTQRHTARQTNWLSTTASHVTF